MNAHHRAVSRYLERYAEPEIIQLASFPDHFRQLIVVPCYRESDTALARFCDWIEQRGNTLMILVSNRPDSDPATGWQRQLEALLQQRGRSRWHEGVLTLFTLAAGSAVLLVDRARHGAPLPAKQGVGLARKIGADIACQLIAERRVRSPWIATTDADAHLPPDYFLPLAENASAAALIYPYRHIAGGDCPLLPTLLYEFSLHYYVEGLRYAGSPYAWHSLGSTLAIHYAHYAKVRGFPRRAGAEDFYLLNKLAKTGSITSLGEPTIELLARHSERVPFGTGPAAIAIARQGNPNATPLYHPAIFTYLKVWLLLLNRLAQQRGAVDATLHKLARQHNPAIDTDHLQHYSETIAIEAALEHGYRHGKTPAARSRHLHTWFDAFRTMKLINWLRDHKLGVIPFDQWPEATAAWGAARNRCLQQRFSRIRSQLAPQPID